MFSFLLNPWMLLGLAGISLPVIAHLLSRRKYDVVAWAAMQFLDPAKKTRRRMKLEELLLLLLRIGMVALLALAAARPWIPGGFLSGFRSSGSRAVVLVIDGSNSMTRTDGLNTLHQNAIRRATEFLATLGAGDEVALIDSRDRPRVVIESPIRDTGVVAEQLRALPPPGGFGDLRAAVERGVAMLGRSSSASREVVVFTDRQRAGWQPDDQAAWERVDTMLQFPAVRPRVWCVDVAHSLAPLSANVSVGQIELSRELTVPGFPLRFRATIRNAAAAPVRVPVRLMLDGQLLAEQQQTVDVPGRGEVTVEFEQLMRQTGTRIVSVVVEPAADAIAADNRSDAAVHVVAALPVLLVNGTPALEAVDRETFFAEVALSDAGGERPWIAARMVTASRLTPDDIRDADVTVLANVASLPEGSAEALRVAVTEGHGLLIFCGDRLTPAAWQTHYADAGLTPGVELIRERESPPGGEPVRVEPLSLVSGWLSRFRSDPARSFLKAGYRRWWLTKLTAAAGPPESETGKSDGMAPGGETDGSGRVTPVVLANLQTGDPLLIETRRGDGTVLIATIPLDRDGSDLPTQADYVPFLHEAIFASVSGRNQRNVDSGQPLLARLSDPADRPWSAETLQFAVPAGEPAEPVLSVGGRQLQVSHRDTLVPGVYHLETTDEPATRLDSFVVNYDHREDEAAELTEDDRARLRTNERLRFAESLEGLAERMYGDETRAELWALLMFLFLVLLASEVWMTRRIVIRGYGQ